MTAARRRAEGEPAIRRRFAATARLLSLFLGGYVGLLITAFYLQRFDVRRHHIESALFWLLGTLLAFAVLTGEREQPADGRAATRRDGLWLVFLAVCSAWIIYSPSFGLGLLSDDFVILRNAKRADFWSVGNEFFRPLPLMLWYALSKVSTSPWLLHFANVTLHGILGAMTGVLGLKLGWGRAWSLFASLLLVVHPAVVEAVAWASGVQDLLMAVCVVSAVLLARSEVRVRAGAFVVLLAAALLSKETAVAAPALLWVFGPGGSGDTGARHSRYVLLAASVVGAYVALRFAVAVPTEEYARLPTAYFVKELVVRPFATLAVPWHAHTIADYPLLGIGWALFPVVLLLVAVWRNQVGSIKRTLRLAAWVLAAIAPVYTYFFVSSDLEGSRYVYLAMPAWVLLVTELLRSALGPRLRWPSILAAAAVLLLAAAGVLANLRPWIAAAKLRDAVLQEARTASQVAGYQTFAFEGLPDSIDGAYVFRNGFDEALGPLPTIHAGDECTFRWNGNRFVRRDAGGSTDPSNGKSGFVEADRPLGKHGGVSSSWTLKDGAFDMSIDVPPNTRATVRLPNAKIDAVTESGRPVGNARGISRARQDGEAVILEVGSGTYVFRYPYPSRTPAS